MKATMVAKIQAANQALLVDGDLAAISEFFTPDYVAHVTAREMTGGHGFVRQYVEMIRGAFSDLEVDVTILVEANERVAWQRRFRGTHRGAFRGFPATGREVVWTEMITSRFEDGLIAEDWVVSDLAERLLMARKR